MNQARFPKPTRLLRAVLLGMMVFASGTGRAAGLPITIQLKYYHNFQFAGYYAAQAQGYYRAAGLDVHIQEGTPAINPVEEVLAGRAQFGVSDSYLVLSRAQGKPVVALGVVFQHAPEVLLVRNQKPGQGLDGLAGKKVMVTDIDSDVIAFLRAKGLASERLVLVPHSFRVQDLVEGRVDAMSAYSIDQPYYLDQIGFPYQIFSPRSAGIDFYGDTLFTDEQELHDHPETVKAFRAASMQGWYYAMAHQEEMVDLILSRYPRQWNRGQLLFEATQMVPLLQPDLVEMGYMNPDRWNRIRDTFASLGMLPQGYSLEGFLYHPRPMMDPRQLLKWVAVLLALGAAIFVYQIQRSNAAFRAIFNAASDAIFIHDVASGAILDSNQRATEMFGHTRDEIRKLPFEALCCDIPPHTPGEVRGWLRKAAEGPPQVFEWLAKDRSGRPFHVEGTMRRATVNGHGRLIVAVRDISARKQAEASLSESEERLRSYIQNAPIGVFECDANGRYLDINPAASRITGYAREELLQMSVPDLLPQAEAEEAGRQFQRLIETGYSFGELQFKKKDGEIGHWSVEAVRLSENRFLGFASDISGRKKNEEERMVLLRQLYQSQKMESLGVLAGGVAHDMNNVLGAILALASTHLAHVPETHALYPSLKTIRDAAIRGGDMVKRLLAFARQTPSEKQEINLNALLLEVARLLERTTLAKVHLDMDLTEDLHPILGDGSALSHALMNLCVNAVDAMSDRGILTFRTRNLGMGQVEVTVEDNGCGMPKEVLERAMDPFFTTKAAGKGTGLGLALVFATVSAHDGRLSLQSEPGQGTRVTMTFPATLAADAERGQAPEVNPEVARQALHVLLVDDDELIQEAAGMLVEALGHTVTLATSGEAALAMLEQGLQPDAVILDINMPGLGGKGTLPLLRGLRPTVPILLATGRSDQEALDLVASQPLVTLLPKPFSFQELQSRFDRVGLKGWIES